MVLLWTTVVFAAYHVDPLWIAAVLPIGFVLGWLRYTTRSVWPGVIAHFGNNSFAVWMVHAEVESIAAEQAAIALMVMLASMGGVWAWYRRGPSTGPGES